MNGKVCQKVQLCNCESWTSWYISPSPRKYAKYMSPIWVEKYATKLNVHSNQSIYVPYMSVYGPYITYTYLRMHICISESLTFWYTSPSTRTWLKNALIAVLTGGRFDFFYSVMDWDGCTCSLCPVDSLVGIRSVFPFVTWINSVLSVRMENFTLMFCRLARQVGNGSIFSFSM